MNLEDSRNVEVEELRRAMGTLPSEAPEKSTKILEIGKSIRVQIVSSAENPYKAIFESATATWGDDQYELKWGRVSPENRYKVCLAALTGQTLPQALEVVGYLFQVRGTPRWLFEEHAREMSQFTTYLSIGCRDNNKLDASMVQSTEMVDESYFNLAKDNYEEIIKDGEGSWQSARAVLPLSYHHPYLFYTSLLSLISNFRRSRGQEKIRPELCFLIQQCVDAVGEKCPLIKGCIMGKSNDENFFHYLDERDKSYFQSEAGV